MRTKRVLPILLVVALMAGCAAKAPVKHPGAINDLDSYAFDTLLTAQGALNEAKVQVAGHPEFKDTVNQAIAAYNAARASYNLFHIGAGSEADLQQQLGDMVKAIAQVQKAFGVTL